MRDVLAVNNLTIRFGGLVAVKNVSFHLNEGEILALIGPNGAGKTTIFNLLTGIYRPNEGTIVFQNRNIVRLKPHKRVALGIARTFQNIRLFSNLSVLENLLVAHPDCNSEGVLRSTLIPSTLRKNRAEVVEKCEELLSIVGLLDQQDQYATSLPYGKQRLLEIARALSTDPHLILLDEPGAGMNPVEKRELKELITFLSKTKKINILLIEHDMKFVMDISERIIVLDYGEIIAEGTAEEVQSDAKVIDAYLGNSAGVDVQN